MEKAGILSVVGTLFGACVLVSALTAGQAEAAPKDSWEKRSSRISKGLKPKSSTDSQKSAATSRNATTAKASPKPSSRGVTPKSVQSPKTDRMLAGSKIKKTVPSSQPMPAQAPAPSAKGGELPLAEFFVYPMRSNIEIGRLAGVEIQSGLYGLRFGSDFDWTSLARGHRVFRLSAKFESVIPVYVDSYMGWAAFAVPGRMPSSLAPTPGRSLPERFVSLQKSGSASELNKEYEMFLKRFSQGTQVPGDSATAALQALLRNEDDLLSELAKNDERLSIEGHGMGPKIKGIKCVAHSPRIEVSELRAFVADGTGLKCQAGTYRKDMNRSGLQLETGVLYLQPKVGQSSDVQRRLLAAVANKIILAYKAEALEIDRLTEPVCFDADISPKGHEASFCTANVVALKELQDSVLAFGHLSGARFYYTILRTGPFSSSGTLRITESVMENFGVRK